MGYLAGFEYEIFISYAHVDDLVSGRSKGGWVSKFYEHLEVMLWQRFGKRGAVRIWWDPELAQNQVFDLTIENAIKESALFISLTSEGYLESDYCRKELGCFCTKAKTESLGLVVGDRRRVFNLLLNNIPHTDWPGEFAGAGGYPFNDASRDDELGFPSSSTSPLFQAQIRPLVDQITKTLRKLKQLEAPTLPNTETPTNEFRAKGKTIFLAATSDGLRRTQERIGNELGSQGINVITDIPPPFAADEHDKLVMEGLSKSDLAVHLLDAFAGFPIPKEKTTYPRRQAELGVDKAQQQLIWLPRPEDMGKVEDYEYEKFLTELENKKRDPKTYKFIRELQSPNSIKDTILEQLNREPDEPVPTSNAALLDIHFKDQPYAQELYQFLIERNIRSYINPEEDDPSKNINLFAQMLKQVNLLIIIFGHVSGDWVHERLGTALQLAITEDCKLKLCAVYFPPFTEKTERRFNPKRFPASFPIWLFDNFSTLATLVEDL